MQNSKLIMCLDIRLNPWNGASSDYVFLHELVIMDRSLPTYLLN